ncbi:MAG: LL-diaminopimelate aminotransferase [Clostridiales bacterium]|nr:LL-diaminopimelate aminotransferase [Clostridiales bacterium]
MVRLNEFYGRLPGSYLFSEVGRRVAAYQAAHPDAQVIRLGIGDVTRPLPKVCIDAMHAATDEMADAATFRGYGPDQGYPFLQQAICDGEYRALGAPVEPGEIFIGDGAKSDTANIQELFSGDCRVAVPDPVYPVYVDSNALAGRAGAYENGRWSELVYLPCVEENGYLPPVPKEKVDLIYLCFPNNPTGAAIDREGLKAWVDYAREVGAVILYDAAYRRYITRRGVPRSIYEIDGADQVAIEFGSFSKTAGFTGLRCSWTVVPKALLSGRLHAMWLRRQATKFNGTAYAVQRAAAAIYTPEGARQVDEMVGYYMENAAVIGEALKSLGIAYSGGVDAPYLWFKCPNGQDSWGFFDRLLEQAQVVGTPGAGFGVNGEGFFRLTGFNTRENTIEAMERFKKVLK